MVETPQQATDPRFAVWIGATVALFLFAAVVGFVLLPSAQPGAAAVNLWGVICRAIGVPVRGEADSEGFVQAQPSSEVAWTPETRQMLADGTAANGPALAATCEGCHGVAGISSDAAFPNLAGQSVASVYKQLEDFRTGRRNPDVMGDYVVPLSEAEMVDLASYYAALPSPYNNPPKGAAKTYPAAQRLVTFGDPARGIAGCAACHSPQGMTQGTPRLEGQQRAYLEQQLRSFKSGWRHNDIGAQMRSVARKLTDAEIAMLSAYYSNFVQKSE